MRLRLASVRSGISEITGKLLRLVSQVVEVRISDRPRTRHEGEKVGWRDGWSAAWTLIRLRFADPRSFSRE